MNRRMAAVADDSGIDPKIELADVARASEGDALAFERLYTRHVDRVYSIACRLVGVDDAEEATQDAFVRAWKKLETFRGDAAFGSWVYRVAVNVCYARLRDRKRHRSRFTGDAPLDFAAARRDPAEIRLDFDVAVERLPDGAREVFVLHDVEGYKHREIAELVGITAGTSKSQLHRARMLLRQHLDAGADRAEERGDRS